MQEQHIEPDNDWNYVHNLMYAIANLMEEGKLKDATALSMKLTAARGRLETTLYIYSTRDSITRLNPRLPVALRTANWAQVIELLKASAPAAEGQVQSAGASRPNLEFLARQLASFAAGMQAVETQDLAKAEGFSAQFDAELWRMSRHLKDSPGMQKMAGNKANQGDAPKLQVMPDALLQPLLSSLSIMSLELRGALLTARGKIGEAKSLFVQAAQQEKALGYREPPNYIRPVGETEGAALVAAGDWTDAKTAYQRAVLERPRSGFVLYDIALMSEKSGDREAAAKEYAEFLTAWKNADAGLAEVAHAQRFLAENQAAAGTRKLTAR